MAASKTSRAVQRPVEVAMDSDSATVVARGGAGLLLSGESATPLGQATTEPWRVHELLGDL